MMNWKISFVLACFTPPCALMAFPQKPWFGNVYEFQSRASYTYYQYPQVQHALIPLHHTAHNHLITLGLGLVPSPSLSAEVEFEVADTTYQKWGFRSGGLQLRYLWLDDVAGDPLSLTTGLSVRGVWKRSLEDVGCPYHSYANTEIHTALGRECAKGKYWLVRGFAVLAAGMANRGYPWLRQHLSFQGNWSDRHQGQVFVESYQGLGTRKDVSVEHFFGYADIQHRSIDVGISYRYLFRIWGSLSFLYTRRVYARSFPEDMNLFSVSYDLPFSLF